MADPNNPQDPELGEWIPPVFRSMVYCDDDGKLWVIDQGTWQWVPKPSSASVTQSGAGD